jgi:hypothetical protein
MPQIFFTTLETDEFISELQSNPLECVELLSAPQIYELEYERIYER